MTNFLTKEQLSLELGEDLRIGLRGSAGLLIVGRPGTGKTVLTTFLMLQAMAKLGARVYIIDTKRSDLSHFARYLRHGDKRVVSSAAYTARLLRVLNENLNNRYKNFNSKFGWDWVDYGLRPCLIVMDEVAATMAEASSGGPKLKNEIQNNTRSLILKGRQAGMFMLLSSQRLSAEVMDRDQTLQLSTRIVMGQADRDTYRMAFPTADLDALPTIPNQPGNGLVYSDELNSNFPRPFQAPDLSALEVDKLVARLDKKAAGFAYADEAGYWQW